MATPHKRRLLVPAIILVWTMASLGVMGQFDLHPVLRYYGWTFTAQVAFLIFFWPTLWRQVSKKQRDRSP
ncbi:hypothetical protein RYO59_002429 [Thermosynechococcaceae cyanobacterium Okahandja]